MLNVKLEVMNNLKFREVAELWCADKQLYVKRSTFAAYSLVLRNHILPVFGEWQSVPERKVQEFVHGKLGEGLSAKTVKDMLVVLRMIAKYGYKHELFPFSEWDIRFPSERRSDHLPVLSVYNQRKLMRFLSDNFTFRNLGILICLNTGMRIGEICGLKWSDVDVTEGVISVNRTVERIYVEDGGKYKTELIMSTPKTINSQREIPVILKLRKILKPLKMVVNDDYYVLSNSPRPIEPRTYRKYYVRLLESLGIPPIKFHGLRHSFATRCIESKCDYKTVSTILGHSNIATTLNLYVHPNMEQKHRCVERMAKLLG